MAGKKLIGVKTQSLFEAQYVIGIQWKVFVAAAGIEAFQIPSTLKGECVLRTEGPALRTFGIQKHEMALLSAGSKHHWNHGHYPMPRDMTRSDPWDVTHPATPVLDNSIEARYIPA
jgi:hypothetical protein